MTTSSYVRILVIKKVSREIKLHLNYFFYARNCFPHLAFCYFWHQAVGASTLFVSRRC